jgi:hypothetical protein
MYVLYIQYLLQGNAAFLAHAVIIKLTSMAGAGGREGLKINALRGRIGEGSVGKGMVRRDYSLF